ncbi:tripartite tricarboxylate transporter TctB family protein [Pollutimonas sp. M17]|uniref:tripartite tricarboxylate transporter TctB family protein n=1 Tax=Pollutimonas sp. M17 TaxID=2962065 RepID=UPI0021F4C09C|nr:tripartite tricarboxylate transporter TctB family protein [Pollutimonas sp. M17]UYO92548.1 tripartite tricarboxylate transporter TctB family protein [Pollutimonas sp. M17]HWK69760.1 tripartite tricarboxylate transporter TctB family protein [Burkholderiaceae bacterium]
MDKDQSQGSPPGGGLSHSNVDAITAVAVFIIGVVMMVDNYRIGVSWAVDGPESGYFPYHIGLILCIAGVAVLLKSLFGKSRNREVFVSWDRFRLVLLVLLPTGVYVLLIQFLGIYVASVLFIGGFMRLLGRIGWLKTVLVSVGVNVLLFWMFEVQFMVPLPKGPLEALFGY